MPRPLFSSATDAGRRRRTLRQLGVGPLSPPPRKSPRLGGVSTCSCRVDSRNARVPGALRALWPVPPPSGCRRSAPRATAWSRSRLSSVPLGLLVAALLLVGCGDGPESSGADPAGATVPGPAEILKQYVDTPDPAYGWTLVSSRPGDGHTVHTIEMTSQTWLTEAEVDRPLWTHWLIVVEPDEVRSDHGFLYISGGRNGGDPPAEANPLTLQPALATGSFTAELRMAPNQPLTFVGDDYGERVEDELIAYGWDKFLRGEDEIWLARLPMTKAAVRAMDTMTAFAASEDGAGAELNRFVVAGGSKRGWTTWTTAMVDDRVAAIVPIVIDMLNLEPSFIHHWQAYGFWAPAVGDYEREGIMDWFGDPRYHELQQIVEPYQHREKLDMPKYLINATGDQFFLPDSSQFYFDDLIGEKHLRYVPNTEHSLGGSDAAVGFLAFYQAVLEDVERPDVDWSLSPTEGGAAITAWVANGIEPGEVLLWQAANPETRDFRIDTIGTAWTSTPVGVSDDGRWVGAVDAPPTGWSAFFLEFTFPGPGEAPFKFSTEIEVVPEDLPFGWPPEADTSE